MKTKKTLFIMVTCDKSHKMDTNLRIGSMTGNKLFTIGRINIFMVDKKEKKHMDIKLVEFFEYGY